MDEMGKERSALAAEIGRFRSFNRMYTRFLGTLNEGLLDSEFTLAEARVLYEVANRVSPLSTEIADALVMDPGYLSRILRKFEQNGLLKKKTSSSDARAAELALTARGKAAFRRLNALSDQQAQDVLSGLSPQAREELLQAMKKIDALLTPGTRNAKPYLLRTHRVADMGWVVYSEARGYAEQFGWNEEFEALVAKIVGEFLVNFDSARERCWIAETDGQHIGHIFLVKHPTEHETAKLRLLFVEPCARGQGLGDALVRECVRFAHAAGYKKIVLWTQSILTSAHRIYQRAGFRLVKEEPHHSFGHDLIGQEWELELRP